MRAGFEPAMTVLQTGALPLGYRTINLRRSHAPFNNIATHNGLEPMTSAVTGRRSNQLSQWALTFVIIHIGLQ